jgi:hypothetical protein
MGADLALLIRIIIAHILTDFFLQPYTWVKGKRSVSSRHRFLMYHSLVAGLLTYVVMLDGSAWLLPIFVAVSHYLIDWWKSTSADTTGAFIADQLAHVIVLFLGWMVYTGSVTALTDQAIKYVQDPQSLIVVGSYIVALRPMGFLIEKLTRKWRVELIDDGSKSAGLTDAGTWIGYIERIIILTFIFIGEFSAIGFLIAAKSIFRFSGGVKDHQERKHAEYILIGTLISFSLAILLGIGALALL